MIYIQPKNNKPILINSIHIHRPLLSIPSSYILNQRFTACSHPIINKMDLDEGKFQRWTSPKSMIIWKMDRFGYLLLDLKIIKQELMSKLSKSEDDEDNKFTLSEMVIQNLKRSLIFLTKIDNMQSNHHFYFSFSFQKMRMQGDIALTLRNWTCFRLQLYRNQHFISTTSNIYCAPNPQGQLLLQKQIIAFSIKQIDQTHKQICQIRLLQIQQQKQEKLLGCYEFLLQNYIKAYEELNRNCIELNVQITENFVIFYDVFLERTQQALTKIIEQHQTAKKYHMEQDNISQMQSFLPEQLGNHTKDDIFKYVKIDQANPHLFSQQYCSNKKIRRFASIVSRASKPSEQTGQNLSSSLSTEPSKVHYRRLKKTISDSSNIIPSTSQCNINQIELQSDPQVEDRLKAVSQLYKVIENDSKIIEPEDMLNHSHEKIIVKEPQMIYSVPRQKRSLRKYIAPITIFILIVMLVALVSVISYSFQRKNNKKRSSKVQFQFHKFSSFVTPKSFP